MTASLPDLSELVKRRMESGANVTAHVQPARIANAILRQLDRDEQDPGVWLRGSNIGRCARQLAYRRTGAPEDGRELDARSRLTFALGDMAEALLTVALWDALRSDPPEADGWRLTSAHQITGQPAATFALPDGETVPCHVDGLLRRGDDLAVLEVKSMSGYGFTRAEQEGWGRDESYWWQIQAYMHAYDAPRAYVLVLCKDSGALAGWWMERDGEFIDLVMRHALRARGEPNGVLRMLPDGTELEPREDLHKTRGTPNQNHGRLPWQCAYCPFFRTCWGDALDERVTRDWRGRPSRALFLHSATRGAE